MASFLLEWALCPESVFMKWSSQPFYFVAFFPSTLLSIVGTGSATLLFLLYCRRLPLLVNRGVL